MSSNLITRLAKLEAAVVAQQMAHLPQSIIRFAKLENHESFYDDIQLSPDEQELVDAGIATVFIFENVED